MRTPTIHLNGSSKQHLLDAYCAAGDTLLQAMDALVAAAPNARDYYPQGPTAFVEAVAEHDARIMKVRAVYAEIAALIDAIDPT
jgi:hypothetical protein